MKTMLEHLIKLAGPRHEPEVTTEKKAAAGPLVRKAIPAALICSVAVAGIHRHRARRG
ncbi:hypothetical protein OG558_33135 [Kribbella sp. NBC_01510]|uniref:hypothetical protein n=1 Tax=Kribbella sp. NBC_01510 TaxID=2903581 RepID=UPI003869F97C